MDLTHIHKHLLSLEGKMDVVLRSLNSLKVRLSNTEKRIMSAFTDLQDAVRAYIAAVEAMNVNVQALIDAAIVKDDADEDVSLTALKDEVVAAQGKITPPTV